MPATEQGQWHAGTGQPFAQRGGRCCVDPLQAQKHHAATTLAQTGSECKTQYGLPGLACQAQTRQRDGLKFDVTTANGADNNIGKHGHPGTGVARNRTLGGVDRDPDCWLQGKQIKRNIGVFHDWLPDKAAKKQGKYDTIWHSMPAPARWPCALLVLSPRSVAANHRPFPESILTKLTRPLLALFCVVTALLASCTAPSRPPAPGSTPDPTAPAPTVPVPSVPADAAPPAVVIPPVSELPRVSNATNAKDYRRDAALHLYAHNAQRIYKGVLQPHLYAIGVLEVDIDRQGQVVSLNWRRAPKHAPEVMNEIIRTVRAAAPYPVPARLGRVTYTDVWLWDRSGKFQLDTLTEGQQ